MKKNIEKNIYKNGKELIHNIKHIKIGQIIVYKNIQYIITEINITKSYIWMRESTDSSIKRVIIKEKGDIYDFSK